MIPHTELMPAQIRKMIRNKNITLAGNVRLKIYGLLNCASGKRMKTSNRVFFSSVKDAHMNNFRPCGHCMSTEYKLWKNEFIQQRQQR
ncbi:MAG: metal-binding protein [Cyclobacteriaceae bacterium]|nr:metal-binding protein [Cyclobacteriaceae bacterium]